MPASGKRLRAVAATDSCGLRHYSAADTGRLALQRSELRQISQGIVGGAGFHVAKALRAHPLYATEAQDRPAWNRTVSCPGKQSTLSNKFTTSFSGMNFEDSSIGSSLGREQRKQREEAKKIQKQQDRIALYESLVAQQEADLKRRAARRKARANKYRQAMSAATTIQSSLARIYLAKMRVARVILARKNVAALVLQMLVRQYLIRAHVRARFNLKIQTIASKKIQFGWSQRLMRVEAQSDLKRRRQQRSRARRRLLREMDNERRGKAAVMIQNMVRCWKGRRIVKLLEMERRRKGRRKNRNKSGGRRGSSRGVLPPKA
jgi:hypothetical protein